MITPFNQPAPRLGNQFDDDRVLRSYLHRTLPPEIYHAVEPELRDMGALAGDTLYKLQLADRLNVPTLTQWDAWGERVDHIEVSPLWKVAERLAAERGVVATAYEQQYGHFSRVIQFALAYLFHPSTDVYTCPLAMTDGAARTLLVSGNTALRDHAVPHLTSRHPHQFWTSGQWMTESTGGSDVGRSETVAWQDETGTWRLYGRKWFTSAAASQMALVLARPEGNPTGGSGLALFYVETRDDAGRLRNITVNRLKDKLGTKKVPTAELTLDGTPALPVKGLTRGVRNMVPMLQVTRTWNSVMAAAFMRRGVTLARDYATKRIAFGKPLAEKPLHADTLATLQAEMEAAFHLSFCLVELLGKEETRTIGEEEQQLLRLLTSIAKLTTGRQVVSVMSEVIEAFGGAGYVEDTGLPTLLRDSQVLPIWEGTTNVLSLDTLRALGQGEPLIALANCVIRSVRGVTDPALVEAGMQAQQAIQGATAWLRETWNHQEALESGGRRFAMTLGRALSLALMVAHAQWSLDHEQDGRARVAALRFAQLGINLIRPTSVADAFALANDTPLTTGVVRERV